jgi:hypothetical protein
MGWVEIKPASPRLAEQTLPGSLGTCVTIIPIERKQPRVPVADLGFAKVSPLEMTGENP